MGFPSFTVFTTGSAVITTSFTGVVIAPNGQINLGTQNNFFRFRGAYFGREVTLFEDGIALHYRDPNSFRSFVPSSSAPFPFIGERSAVTGGDVVEPGLGQNFEPTDEANQTEAVSAVSRNGSAFVVSVGYNDFTNPRPNPTLIYQGVPGNLDARDGLNGRLIKKGTSLMGWSYSADGGRTFQYGGKLSPPFGWSLIWGDSAMAKADIDDPTVYYAQLAGTTAAFDAVADPQQQAITSAGQNVANALTGYCIARSTSRGIDFPSIACINDVFQDGSSLAVARDSANRRQVYVGGTLARVWRMDGESMAFSASPLADPFPSKAEPSHPRMRVFGGVLYIVQQHATAIRANRLNATANATTWLGEATLATDVAANAVGTQGGNALTFPPFSFDFGLGIDGTNKFRLMYTSAKPPQQGAGFRVGIKIIECSLDFTTCQTLGASTLSQTGQEAGPSLRFGGGTWAASWRKQDGVAPGLISMVVGRLLPVGGGVTLEERTIYPGVVPCSYGGDRWGEYNHMDSFGDGRFFAPYTVNGPGCRWRGQWTSDAHIGASVFGF